MQNWAAHGLIWRTACARAGEGPQSALGCPLARISRRSVMVASIWDFLKDGSNQAVLSWIGGAIAAIAAAIWAVVKFMAKNGDQKPSKTTVIASHSGKAAGRDSNINPRGSAKR